MHKPPLEINSTLHTLDFLEAHLITLTRLRDSLCFRSLPSMIPFLASLVRTKLYLQTFSMLHENFLRLATHLALLQTSTHTPNFYLSTVWRGYGLFFRAKRDVQSAHGQLSKTGMTPEV
ncbi:hypothetical protein A264_01195 [Pseudomonas syringae pv. actinidiae ICMP 19071]|uniref:Uncharacterized protein n=2 Tax=Pseudomonas syringae group TaxID=136849 RepID=A0A261WBT8_9PSED|nr:hypothetical protein CT122_30825 [Pseudomonas syringae pv. actinidiae]EPM64190.1 hypothetical protein A264_01195 [Pseudomonas syringae pv. actinidiae ICMP 19071]EPM80776.1 hypothetical protein A3SO_01250 [Pseudomonas syringae pv. actinidiae ICMP 19072]OZI83392.1 hypothetical protein CFN58_31695 [Pseudomonas avellanae]PIN62732.1 hypothetical protein CUB86_04285 [Pseudomonas syringae pv. actinidiae]